MKISDMVLRGEPAGHTDDFVPPPLLSSAVPLVERVREFYQVLSQAPDGTDVNSAAIGFLAGVDPSLPELKAAVIANEATGSRSKYAVALLSCAYATLGGLDIVHNVRLASPPEFLASGIRYPRALIIEAPVGNCFNGSGDAIVLNESEMKCVNGHQIVVNRSNITTVEDLANAVINLNCVHKWTLGSLAINFGRVTQAKVGMYNPFSHSLFLVNWAEEPLFFQKTEGATQQVQLLVSKHPLQEAPRALKQVYPAPTSRLAQYLDELKARLQGPALEVTAYLRSLTPHATTNISKQIMTLAQECP